MKFLFDLDGTLTMKETLPVIAEHFGIEEQIIPLTQQTVQGIVPFEEGFMKRVHILRQFPVSEIARVVCTVPLHPLLLRFIRQHRADSIIVSGNLDCWCQTLLMKIDCTYFCSQAKVEADKVVAVLRLLDKEAIVRMYQEQGEQVVFIGDGHNDLEAMQQADLALVCGLSNTPAPSLLSVADRVFYDEKELVDYLDQLKDISILSSRGKQRPKVSLVSPKSD